MAPEIWITTKKNTGISYSETDWEKLCFLFNEGEYSDEILVYLADEGWEELKEYNKILHDSLLEFFPDGVESITIHES